MRSSIRAIAAAALLLAAYRAGAHDVTITSGPSSGGSWMGNTWTPNADGATVSATEIAQHLASGPTTVSSTDGDALAVRASLNWSARTLTLSASGDLAIEASLGASGTAGLALEYGQGSMAAGNTASYRVAAPVNLAATASFATRQGSDGMVANYTILTSLGSENSASGLDLQGMQGNLAGSYALGADIAANATATWNAGAGFAPVGTAASPFTGTFDGLGHTIDALGIDRATTDGVGLFGYASVATLRNVTLANADILGRAFVGALVGRGMGANRVDNAVSSGTVESTSTSGTASSTGGLAGLFSGTVSNSHSSATVTAFAGGGGLVGRLGSSGTADITLPDRITHSWASGNVNVSGGAGGGLVGASHGRLDHVHATGNVDGGAQLGGLVGMASESEYWTNAGLLNLINVSHATGSVTGHFASNVAGSGDRIGGLVGYMTGSVDIGNSFATGNVAGHNAVGGLVGFLAGTVNDVYTANINAAYTLGGTVAGNDYVGGLVGQVNGYTRITRAYVASGMLSGTATNAKVGGMLGWQAINGDRITMYAVVWNTQTTGTTHLSGGDFFSTGYAYGATTAEMMTETPYMLAGFTGYNPNDLGRTILTDSTAAGHEFDEDTFEGGLYNVFRLYEGRTYPLLMGFLETATVGADLSGSNKTYDGQIASGTVGSYSTDIPVDAGKILGSLSYATNNANAGTYTVNGGGLNVSGGLYSVQSGYNIIYNPDTSVVIAKAPLGVGTTDVTKVYDGTTSANGTAIVVGGTLFRNDGIAGGQFAFADKNAGTGKTVSVAGVTVNDGNNGGNYAVTYVSNTHGAITKAPASVIANSDSVVYNGHAQSVSGYSVSGLVDNETPGVLSGLSESGGSGTDVGNYAHTVSGTDGNYALSFTPGSLTITPRAQVLSFPPQYAPIRYFSAGSTFPIGPLASSDAAPYSTSPIVYSSLSGSVCSVAGTTVTMLAIGTCTIAADQAADANHTAAAQVTQVVELSGDAPPLVLWIDGSDFVRYGGHADYTVTLTAAGNAANAASVVFALSGDVDAASASLVCEGGSDGASCVQDANDPLRFSVTLPASRTLTWHVSVPVRGDASGETVGLSVDSADATAVAATTTLVIFRNGFDAP